MTAVSFLAAFSILDALALAGFFASWVWIGWRIEHPSAARPSASRLMADYRRNWMVQMVTRELRIFDSSVLATLREGTSFFASASMIAIGGGLALIGDPGRLSGFARNLGQDVAPDFVWQVKLLLSILLLAAAFLGFVWSQRLFGYCAVVMASVANDPDEPSALPRAAKAAEINISAARSFNRGLRAVYFAMAALTWLIGPVPFLATTALTLAVLWRREFASASRRVLFEPDAP